GREPKPVYVFAVNDVKYDFADFQKYAMTVPSTPKKVGVKAEKTALVSKPRASRPGSTDLAKLEAALRACEEAPLGSRSEPDYALVCRAVSLGLDADAVWEAVSGISKFSERQRESYFDPMWRKAEAGQEAEDAKFAELDAALEMSKAPGHPPALIA